MRITVSHTKSKEEVMRAVDRSFDDLFRGIAITPVQFVDERRNWQDSRMDFVLKAKMGFVKVPIRGTIEVTDRDIIIDVDLGLLERLLGTTQTREAITTHVRGLLT